MRFTLNCTVPPEVGEAVKAKAAEDGTTVSALVTQGLRMILPKGKAISAKPKTKKGK